MAEFSITRSENATPPGPVRLSKRAWVQYETPIRGSGLIPEPSRNQM
jgi:hypothetical protein